MNIGFIGAGKMAQAIVAGLVNKGGIRPEEISASARTEETLGNFQRAANGKAFITQDNKEVISRSEVIILAVKPQLAGKVIPLIREVSAGKLFISVIAGLTTFKIESWLDPQSRVVRTMPNTPCLIGQGIIAIAGGARSTKNDLVLVSKLLGTTGKVVELEESHLDAVTSISGSGPAYVYHFIEELIRAGVEQGLPESLSKELAVQTVLGAANMILTTGEKPHDLANRVKSPGGTTMAACEVLERKQWGLILREAVAIARKRAGELSSELGA